MRDAVDHDADVVQQLGSGLRDLGAPHFDSACRAHKVATAVDDERGRLDLQLVDALRPDREVAPDVAGVGHLEHEVHIRDRDGALDEPRVPRPHRRVGRERRQDARAIGQRDDHRVIEAGRETGDVSVGDVQHHRMRGIGAGHQADSMEPRSLGDRAAALVEPVDGQDDREGRRGEDGGIGTWLDRPGRRQVLAVIVETRQLEDVQRVVARLQAARGEARVGGEGTRVGWARWGAAASHRQVHERDPAEPEHRRDDRGRAEQ